MDSIDFCVHIAHVFITYIKNFTVCEWLKYVYRHSLNGFALTRLDIMEFHILFWRDDISFNIDLGLMKREKKYLFHMRDWRSEFKLRVPDVLILHWSDFLQKKVSFPSYTNLLWNQTHFDSERYSNVFFFQWYN